MQNWTYIDAEGTDIFSSNASDIYYNGSRSWIWWVAQVTIVHNLTSVHVITEKKMLGNTE